MLFRVLVLQLAFKYDLEHANVDLGRLIKPLKRSIHKGMHMKAGVSLIIVTEEAPQELLTRLGPVLEDLTGLDNFWCYVAPQADDIVGLHGSFDPLCHHVRKAWMEARERSKPQNVRYGQRWQRRV